MSYSTIMWKRACSSKDWKTHKCDTVFERNTPELLAVAAFHLHIIIDTIHSSIYFTNASKRNTLVFMAGIEVCLFLQLHKRHVGINRLCVWHDNKSYFWIDFLLLMFVHLSHNVNVSFISYFFSIIDGNFSYSVLPLGILLQKRQSSGD